MVLFGLIMQEVIQRSCTILHFLYWFSKLFCKLPVQNHTSMNRVQQVLSRKATPPVSVPPDTSVYKALQIMADKNIGSVIVMQGNEYLGIVTERDYSRKVILQNKHSDTTAVSEIMTADLPQVSPNDTIDHCMELMTGNNIRYLPVFENNQLAGIISMSDVVKATILSQQQTINHLNEYLYS